MTSDDVLTRAAPPPDFVVSYRPGSGAGAGVRPGSGAGAGVRSVDAGAGVDARIGAHADAGQVADVRLPPPAARVRPAPLVLFLHGGFWRAAYDRAHTGPLATALAGAGFAVCAPEFRRTGQRGGGWPGTFDDVAAATDQLPAIVREVAGAGVISSEPPILAGHSAGGHLALWAAARHNLTPDTPWHSPAPAYPAQPLPPARLASSGQPPPSAPGPVAGVVALAAVSDLAACHALRLGRGAAAALLGGGPDKYPERYLKTDPVRLLPLGCPVRLVHGTADDVVPCSISTDFLARARAAGDDVTLAALPGTGHFDVIDPLTAAWPSVLAAFSALVS
jgi:acetyl esterase/lipase